jgi:vacuolar-type H+-ATPase catalytic subunit A/Vma1
MEELKEKVAEYEDIKEKKSALTKREKELKKFLEENMEDSVEYPTPKGKMIVRMRTSYSYSNTHTDMKDKLKEQEVEEKAKGVAEVSETPTLYYYSND